MVGKVKLNANLQIYLLHNDLSMKSLNQQIAGFELVVGLIVAKFTFLGTFKDILIFFNFNLCELTM